MAKVKNPFAMDPRLVETLVRKNPIYKGKMVNFCVDDIRLPNGHSATREYLDHPGAVAVVPFLDRQRWSWCANTAIPQASHPESRESSTGESPLICVKRERGDRL